VAALTRWDRPHRIADGTLAVGCEPILEFVDRRLQLGGLGGTAVGIERMWGGVTLDVVEADLTGIVLIKYCIVDSREPTGVVDGVQLNFESDSEFAAVEHSILQFVFEFGRLSVDPSVERRGCFRIEHAPDRRDHRLHTPATCCGMIVFRLLSVVGRPFGRRLKIHTE